MYSSMYHHSFAGKCRRWIWSFCHPCRTEPQNFNTEFSVYPRQKTGWSEGRTYNNEGANGITVAMDDRRERTAMGTTVTGRCTVHYISLNPTRTPNVTCEALGCVLTTDPTSHTTPFFTVPTKIPQKDRGYTRYSAVVPP